MWPFLLGEKEDRKPVCGFLQTPPDGSFPFLTPTTAVSTMTPSPVNPSSGSSGGVVVESLKQISGMSVRLERNFVKIQLWQFTRCMSSQFSQDKIPGEPSPVSKKVKYAMQMHCKKQTFKVLRLPRTPVSHFTLQANKVEKRHTSTYEIFVGLCHV